MKRLTLIGGIVVLVAALGYFGFRIERHLEETDATVAALTRQVNDASKLAQQESAAAADASQRAIAAELRARAAAGARLDALQQRDQAEVAQSQAELAAQQSAAQANQAQAALDTLQKQRHQELDQMQAALSKVVDTRRTANGMVMVLPDSTFKFDFDSAELRPRNRELLSRVAGILLASKGFGLSVFGYTDDVGSKEYNQQLSERRAEAVRGYLVQAGIDPGIINAKGFGKTNPLINAQTDQARATNRRVEIAVTDSEIQYGGLAGQ